MDSFNSPGSFTENGYNSPERNAALHHQCMCLLIVFSYLPAQYHHTIILSGGKYTRTNGQGDVKVTWASKVLT